MVLFGVGAAVEGFWALPALNSAVFWANVVFLGCMVSFLGSLFCFRAIQTIGATRASMFINLVFVFGTLLSVLVLSGSLYWTSIAGLVLVVSGISVVNLRTDRTPPDRQT